ncbi:MAG: hypothetical protein JW778_02005 [Candidatus Altiarchaeota archaeon]|nr:hypothetical protein [Candidatus Altiarchaeota archaeon]
MEKIKEVSSKPPAIVIELGLNGLGVLRSLSEQKVPVIGVTWDKRAVGLYSRFGRKLISPNPLVSEEVFINFLLSLGLEDKRAVLFPTGDISVVVLSKHQMRLEKYFDFVIGKPKVIEQLVNKADFYKSLAKSSVPHPKTYFPRDDQDLKKISEEIDYPCIIKPSHSASFVEEFGVKVFEAYSQEELLDGYVKARRKGYEVLLQEIVPGGDDMMYLAHLYMNKNFKPLATFTFKRIRQWPHRFGNGALCESIWVPEISEFATSFLSAIGYNGIADVEFKKDAASGEFKLIEVNPRTGWQNRLSTKCGLNVPYIAYIDITGKDNPPINSQEDRVKWIYLINDFKSAYKLLCEKKLTWRGWLHSIRGKKIFAVLALDDPLPFFVSIYNLTTTLFTRVCNKVFNRF